MKFPTIFAILIVICLTLDVFFVDAHDIKPKPKPKPNPKSVSQISPIELVTM
jgi:hypothetical protein